MLTRSTKITASMSIIIHLEDFQSWSEVFREIERQRKMRSFEIIQPTANLLSTTEKIKGNRS